MEYSTASDSFNRFLLDAAGEADLVTRHQAYTMVEGVLRAFGRRLDAAEAIRFAQVLPPLLRSLFIGGWMPGEPRAGFVDRAALSQEVQALRRHHNLSPDSAIANVAATMRRHVDPAAFDCCLDTLPTGARAFWA
jgi:uncharacterized protein (DUF2267 family)